MRLGDYDAFIARINKCVGIDGLGLEPLMAIRDINALISEMPTIPAISVEWLKKIQAECVHDTVQVPMYVSIGWLIDMWQKEQEARK